MINIKKFVEIRKSLKLSQTELCEGICTQSTLSKFENNGRIPSFKILNKLCDRMNITLADIMIDNEEADVTKALFDADVAFITFDYVKINNILNKIKPDKIIKPRDRYHYEYLKGQLALKVEHDEMSALYYFNGILTSSNLPADDIYRLLALNGCSEVYASQGENEKAEHYFDDILKYIMKVKINNSEVATQVLSVLCDAGDFYGKQHDFKNSNKLLDYAYHLCAQNHIVFFLSRILLRAALNEISKKASSNKILTTLHDAAAFARLNNNTITLNKIQHLIKEVEG